MLPVVLVILLLFSAVMTGLIARRRARPNMNGRAKLTLLLGCASVMACLIGLLSQIGSVMQAESSRSALPFGFGSGLRLDALSFVFLLPLLGICLAAIWQNHLLSQDLKSRIWFPSLALLWAAAFCGALLADRVFLIIFFWFLGILAQIRLLRRGGDLPAGRTASQHLAALQGFAALCFLAGLLLLAWLAGSRDIVEIAHSAEAFSGSRLAQTALILILLGGLAGAAQVPFRRAQNEALAAPPQVLALLFASGFGMLSLYLLMRLSPAFAGADLWRWTLLLAGLATLLIGAIRARLCKVQSDAVAAIGTCYAGISFVLLSVDSEAAMLALLVLVLLVPPLLSAGFLCSSHSHATSAANRLGLVPPKVFAAMLVVITLPMPFIAFAPSYLLVTEIAAGWPHLLLRWGILAIEALAYLLLLAGAGHQMWRNPPTAPVRPSKLVAPMALLLMPIALLLLDQLFWPLVQAAGRVTLHSAPDVAAIFANIPFDGAAVMLLIGVVGAIAYNRLTLAGLRRARASVLPR